MRHTVLAAGLLVSISPAFGAAPVISNVRASQRPGTHYVDIYYNVSDADGDSPLTVCIYISADGGATWNVPVFTTSGALGPGVTLGNDRQIVWNAGADWPGQFNSQCKVRIVVDDGTAPPAPNGMAYIPAGAFHMGDPFNEGDTNTLPRHTVFISSFFMDTTEVSKELWLDVYSWATGNGYGFDHTGLFKDINHPVHTISWFDAVKWCNARSQKEGHTPCYYTDAGLTTVYQASQVMPHVMWDANGYRLPTEAEWERAARGGLIGKRFPWGDTISHSHANYNATGGYSYDLSDGVGYHPTYYVGGPPYTSPVGSFAANAHGLKDVAGNLWEWCWDWYGANWYANIEATQDNPRGPTSGIDRVLRGGMYAYDAYSARCANRGHRPPTIAAFDYGFRCVRAR